MESFADRVAIVTGGASGIGQALCDELARRGASVLVADVNAEGAELAAAAIRAQGGRAQAHPVDVTDADQVSALVSAALDAHGRLDYMFNNAGTGFRGDARDISLDCWRRFVDLNLWGAIHGTLVAYPVMARQGFGHLVNTASLAGLVPSPMQIPYAATKHAVVGLSLSLRYEAADLGVRVSVVCPGYVRTRIHQVAEVLNAPREEALARVPFKLAEVGPAARAILRGVARNQAVIVWPAYARLLWWAYRLNFPFLGRLGLNVVRDFRALRTDPAGPPRTDPAGPPPPP